MNVNVPLHDVGFCHHCGKSHAWSEAVVATWYALQQARAIGYRLVGPEDVTVTVEGLAEAMWTMLRTQGRGSVVFPEDSAAILAALSADKEGQK